MEDEFEIVVSGRNPAALIRNQAWESRVRLSDLESLSGTDPEDGLRVLQGLRHAGDAGKVIVHTSCTERSIAVGAIRYGAMDVLSKHHAIPEISLDSKLFGYERGALTDAIGQKKGKVEFAHNGTLFLNEVGELPDALQAKLMWFLRDRTFERVGGHQRIEMNVPIIAATNVNLQEAIEKGTFREDLYDCLRIVHINVPPLRERGEDVPLMATAFLRQAAIHYGKQIHGFTHEALEAMQAYTWPGNVRELSMRVGRAVVMAEGTRVRSADLDIPHHIARQDEGSISLKVNQQRVETDLIMKAFTLCRWVAKTFAWGRGGEDRDSIGARRQKAILCKMIDRCAGIC